MNIVFYYPDYDPTTCGGTRDALDILKATLEDEKNGHICSIYNAAEVSNQQLFNCFDILVCVTSSKWLDLNKIKIPKILWNHCWDFVEGMDKKLGAFDMIMALSPKHAAHLGTKHWCCGGIDTKVFYHTDMPKQKNLVLYCGGPYWWKGSKKIPEIKQNLEAAGYELECVWGVSHKELAEKFNKAQFVIIPSEIESFCLVSVQAQACGCIPIAHDVGGISETLCEYNADSYLYDTDYVGTINRLADYHLLCIGEHCIKNAERFDINVVAKRFCEMMRYV